MYRSVGDTLKFYFLLLVKCTYVHIYEDTLFSKV